MRFSYAAVSFNVPHLCKVGEQLSRLGPPPEHVADGVGGQDCCDSQALPEERRERGLAGSSCTTQHDDNALVTLQERISLHKLLHLHATCWIYPMNSFEDEL